ncbi:hypothetical protein [Lishizhenia sp.]|uniref:hypothetical protein n=1 Tax=Lishizhenia sp. TaxID=2497594 RepID=UPI00299ECE35|nr:hypothetical protein [Lishizhenia sp.]MDX1445585.1 hypothetical protein [Lishizhenia sp.]
MKTIQLMILGLCLPFLGKAQTTTPALRINEAYMSLGGQGAFSPGLSQQTYEKLAPNSSLLLNNYGNYYYYSGSANYKLGVGLQFRDKTKTGFRKHIELRVGLSYNSYRGYNSYRSSYEKTPYDTLVSQQTGQEYYIDSIYTEYSSINHNFDMLSIDASLIFRTNAEARWSLYGGIGATYGTSLYSRTNVNSGEYGYTVGAQTGSSYSWNSSNNKNESYRNEANTAFTVYVPVGLDFRIANNNEFFKNLHLYTELTPNFTLQNIGGFETMKSPGLGMNFGAYYRF